MDNLEHRLKCIENLLIVAIDRIDELEAQIECKAITGKINA